jgi:hypothetical protein
MVYFEKNSFKMKAKWGGSTRLSSRATEIRWTAKRYVFAWVRPNRKVSGVWCLVSGVKCRPGTEYRHFIAVVLSIFSQIPGRSFTASLNISQYLPRHPHNLSYQQRQLYKP